MNKLVLTLTLLLSGPLASADNYFCGFTEPFFDLVISVDDRTVIENYYGMPDTTLKITDMIEANGMLALVLANGKFIEINHNKIGSDGMSDQNYPYKVQYNGYWGACESEQKLGNTLVRRWRSVREKMGLVFFDFWQGEMSRITGYKVIRDVTLTATSTWESVERSQVGKGTCSFHKDKLIVPIEGEKIGEVYSTLNPVFEYQAEYDDPDMGIAKGDNLRLLGNYGEGICLVEKEGKLLDTGCPSKSFQDNEAGGGGEYNEIAPYGEYAYVQCREGHSTWVHEDVLGDKDFFQYGTIGIDF